MHHVALLFNRTSPTGKCVYLQPASDPPMSCSLNFLPYMVRQREEKERRGKRKHFQKAERWRKVWSIVMYQMVEQPPPRTLSLQLTWPELKITRYKCCTSQHARGVVETSW